MTEWTRGNLPSEKGWYAVMISGDSESIDGFEVYSCPDYQTFAFWTPAEPAELEDWEGGYRGAWNPQHDEEPETIFAFFGPFVVPSYSPVEQPVNGDDTCAVAP